MLPLNTLLEYRNTAFKDNTHVLQGEQESPS